MGNSLESESFYASARLWDDGVIRPEDTREVLALSLMISLNNLDYKDVEKNNGVFRM